MILKPPDRMTYGEWSTLSGKHRWYHKDGTARVLLPLDHKWKDVYDIITRDTDMYFWYRRLPEDINYFTSYFFSTVPTVWLKYKTMLEMFLGTLDGTTIDPLMFEAGYTRTTEHTLNNDNAQDSKYTDNSTIDRSTNTSTEQTYNATGSNTTLTEDTVDKHTDDVSTDRSGKGRTLNYLQGVQGLTAINDGNIGTLGNRYASSIVDSVNQGDENSTTNFGAQHGTGKSSTNTTDKQDTDIATTSTEDIGHERSGDSLTKDTRRQTFNERVHETRINYYDNLAFLRERMDRLKLLYMFHKDFEICFTDVISFNAYW